VAGSGVLHADATLLRRAVGNLVANAIRYTPPQGSISLEATVVAGATLIGVANPGPGIPPDQIERIFDRFYRADLAQQRQRFQWSGPGHRAHHHGFASGRCQRIQ
jgi:two-component system heavy metal sensor histidine kinase CusS